VRPDLFLVLALKTIHAKLLLPILQQPCCRSQLVLVICARLLQDVVVTVVLSTRVVKVVLRLKGHRLSIMNFNGQSMRLLTKHSRQVREGDRWVAHLMT
jgi:hypothetical protein